MPSFTKLIHDVTKIIPAPSLSGKKNLFELWSTSSSYVNYANYDNYDDYDDEGTMNLKNAATKISSEGEGFFRRAAAGGGLDASGMGTGSDYGGFIQHLGIYIYIYIYIYNNPNIID